MRPCCVRLLALADDLTGALEIGGIFGGRGVVSLVSMTRMPELPGPDASTSILTFDTDSRHAPPDAAARRVAELARCAALQGIPLIYKKTDSTLRGNIGVELRALVDAFPGQTLVYAPAYPKLGRTCKGGSLYVHGTPVHETAFATDPLSPVTCSSVRAHVAAHFGGLDVCECGPEEVPDILLQSGGPALAICDGETEEDLARTARALLEADGTRLAAGPAGLARAIAQELDLPVRLPVELQKPARILIVCGSLNPVSRGQVEHVEAQGTPVITPSVEELFPPSPFGGPLDGALADHVATKLRVVGHAMLYTAPSAAQVEACLERAARLGMEGREAHQHIARRIGQIVSALAEEAGVDALVLCGGDTARAVLEAFGNPIIEGVGEVAAGVPRSRFRAAGRELQLVTKAGGFGAPDVFSAILRALAEGG